MAKHLIKTVGQDLYRVYRIEGRKQVELKPGTLLKGAARMSFRGEVFISPKAGWIRVK